MKELDILKFINSHPTDWREKLNRKPYKLNIKELGEYIIFNYSQFDSDMSIPLVKEARGIIFYKPTWTPVRMAFEKFFNYGEENAAEIDWNTARVQAKIDGSLLSIWYHNGEWHYSSNGMIDAKEVRLTGFNCDKDEEKIHFSKTLYEIFLLTLSNANISLTDFLSRLNPKHCYTFEICSPYNKVVVQYEKPLIFHTGTRDMETLNEIEEDIGILKPTEYQLSNIEDVVSAANILPENNEGYVVVDSNYNRLKIKSPWYVLKHHAITDSIGFSKLLSIYLSGEGEVTEFLSYFPKYGSTFEAIQRAVDCISMEYEKEWKLCEPYSFMSPAEYSFKVRELLPLNSGYPYAKYKDRNIESKKYLLSSINVRKLIKRKVKEQ